MTLHIACSTDSRLAADCAVMLASLSATNPNVDLHVHFLHDDRLAREDLANLGSLARNGGINWHPIAVPPEVTARFPHTDRYGYSAWYRILLPEILGSLDRVLYLDSDLLILDELQPFYETALGDACLAAVTQPTLPDVLERLQDTLGLPDAASYFNSGVMTLDLDRIREGRYVDEVLAFITEGRGPMPWADQDPLNAVLHSKRVRADPRWNLMTPVFDLPAEMLPWTADEIRDAIASPAIVHFIGPYKPWHYRCRHPYRAAYFDYLQETPWSGKEIEGRTLRNVLVRPWPPRWQPNIDASLDRAVAKARTTAGRVRRAVRERASR